MASFLIAPDSFKGSLSAIDFCQIATQTIQDHSPESKVISRPMSDGGEGFIDAIVFSGLAEKVTLSTQDPLGRTLEASYAWQEKDKVAVIEMAQASGLPLLAADERDPLKTSTFGTGLLIKHAIEQGAQHIVLGLGGSATNDGGIGALQALGLKFYDQQGVCLPDGAGGGDLLKIAKMDSLPVYLNPVSWTLACDVTNPLLGETGATAIFGPQKGVMDANHDVLENGLEQWAKVIQSQFQKDILTQPSAGAAGGMAGGFMGVFDAQVRSGFDLLAERVGLETLLKDSAFDWVVTGEGKIDEQTTFGKLPSQIAHLGNRYGVPTIGLCGVLEANSNQLPEFKQLQSIHGQMPANSSLPELIEATPGNLAITIELFLAHLDEHS